MQALKFSDLNPLGKGIIIAIAGLTACVAALSFVTSYGALYAWIRDTGLYADSGRYADRLNQAWPLLLDAMFIIAQGAAILGKILHGSRWWPWLTMAVTGVLTLWFNIQHAGTDPGKRLAAVIPPVMMMLAFEIDVSIAKWVMRALGKPLDGAGTALSPMAYPQPYAGAVYRPDGAPVWAVPPGGPAAFAPPGAYGQMPSVTTSGTSQNGHGNGDGGQSDAAKKRAIVSYLEGRAAQGPEHLETVTASAIVEALHGWGMEVSERHASRVLDEWAAARRATVPRKRATRAPKR
jgi:hypothetical protein